MTVIKMSHAIEPRKDLLDRVGNLDELKIFNNQVLIATYIRPEKTKGGIIMTQNTRDEDRYQSKVGLVLKFGRSAFVDDDKWSWDGTVNTHDWIVFRPSDGWNITINNVPCRILEDTSVRCRIEDPDKVW